ncbi:hypothetical protein [Hymenobacter rubripertinctus]|uniref:Uncharacterized protein n=1 Tax=Hymenobacter rubripertinctus TaxID=2029981 RepID=A0A418R4A8_9BACT|nr:hypothetical protein [Hymenobacter rubripertinctus]RIY12204.1 hypothetical protein D0T11_06085 [Hymenobacter rubripertinctus]
MKKTLLLAAVLAFSTAAFAQEVKTTTRDNTTGAKTTVTERDNGTVKVESRTGRTEAGEVVHDTKRGTKRVARKTGNAVETGAKKTGWAVKKGAKAVKNKAEDIVD